MVAGSGVSWEQRVVWDATTRSVSGYFASPHAPAVPRAVAGVGRQ